MPHVDDGTLHALLDGALRAHEPDRADRVEAHLDACADCRARFEEAATLRDRAADVLGALDAGVAPADAAGATGVAGPVPDFQDVLARASAGRAGQEPAGRGADAPDGAGVPGGPDGSERADDIRRRYQWTRGLAWAATIVVALGTGYLVRDLAGPTGVVPARSALEQSAEEPAPAAGSPASPDVADVSSAADQEAGAAGAVPEAPTGAGDEPGYATEAAADAGERRADVEAPGEERELVAADALAPTAAVDRQADDAAGGAAGTGAGSGTPWRTASVEEAEARAGAVLRLPTASLVSVELGPDGSVRTRQRLGRGVEIEVVQESQTTLALEEPESAPAGDRTERQRAEARVAAAEAQVAAARAEPEAEVPVAKAMAPTAAVPSLMGLDLDSAAATVAAPLTVAVARDGYVLTLTGLLPEDVLRALAATAAPRAP